ncbi:MAG: hypothetical protein DMF51_02505 [Acidobacteria bacterium]|nr:MAG: hypothetical protein DMF51_02505 [Acidobacteriota bacterium]
MHRHLPAGELDQAGAHVAEQADERSGLQRAGRGGHAGSSEERYANTRSRGSQESVCSQVLAFLANTQFGSYIRSARVRRSREPRSRRTDFPAGVSVPREYPTQCWSCLGEFDASSAIWCSCSARSASKLCPFCFRCFCQADVEYRESFWKSAPEELKEERDILKGGAGSSGEALIRSNLLSTDQLVSALRWQNSRGGSLDDALVDLGFVSRDNLELVVNRQAPAGTSTMDLSKGLVDASLVTVVSVDLCYRKRILPISKEIIGEKEVLTLAMAGPTDVETIDQVQSLTNCRVIPLNASEKDILERLQDLFPKEIAALRAGEPAAPTPSAAGTVSPPAPQRPKPPPPPLRPSGPRRASQSPPRPGQRGAG